MTLIPASYFGYAIGIALALAAVAWGVEVLLGRRLGFFFNVTTILIIVAACTFFTYRELTECVLSNAPAFPQCEWSAAFLWLELAMTATMLPLLIVSAVVLGRRSRRSIQRPA